jgi:hypothetical protein
MAVAATTNDFASLTISEDNIDESPYLVWFDKTEQITLELLHTLRAAIPHLETFSDTKKFVRWVESQPLTQRLYVILSEAHFGTEILRRIYNTANLGFYIHCQTDEGELYTLAKKYDRNVSASHKIS